MRAALLPVLLAAGCATGPLDGVPARPVHDPDGPPVSCADDEAIQSTDGVRAHRRYARAGYDRVIVLVAPNGLPIRIYAQPAVSAAQMHRAMGLLRTYLADAPGTRFGEDKADVADKMAENEAVLMMPEGADGDTRLPLRLRGQPLYQNETPVEGHAWYMDNDYDHRDAAFEEIFHLVHDTGIGTNEPGARPEYQAELLAEAEAALGDGRWGSGEDAWIKELRREGSLAQEYIASVLDSSMGLWAPWQDGTGGMWGIYIAKDRDEVQDLDPEGWDLLSAFLSPDITGEMRVHPDFDGTFHMAFDPDRPYTHKSRYLRDVALQGSADAALVGNELDNRLRGNAGDNLLDGGEARTPSCCARPGRTSSWPRPRTGAGR